MSFSAFLGRGVGGCGGGEGVTFLLDMLLVGLEVEPGMRKRQQVRRIPFGGNNIKSFRSGIGQPSNTCRAKVSR